MASKIKSPYRVLRRPLVTEKGARESSLSNAVVFEVKPDASKTQIKDAVEKIFDVKVRSVRTLNYMGKKKRVGNRTGQLSAWKKAYVALEAGSSIDLIEGL